MHARILFMYTYKHNNILLHTHIKQYRKQYHLENYILTHIQIF